MAVKSSGQLAMTEIVAEFGGDAPHAMSEYYGGGDKVPAGANPGVATSGMTKFGDFYDSVAATVLTISGNTSNYNIKTAAIAAGGDQATPVILTINAGVTVNSSSSSTPAMKTDTGWSNGVTVNITNNGSIVGTAGAAGNSGSNTNANPGSGGGSGGTAGHPNSGGGSAGSSGSAGSGSASGSNAGNAGGAGGNAFEHSQTADNNLAVIFDTAGTRTAGAGGAGGSGGTHTVYGNGGGGGGSPRGWFNWAHQSGGGYDSGGGGGGGAAGGSGGSGHTFYGPHALYTAGSAGGSTSGGAGGVTYRRQISCSYCASYGQDGGRGGNLQQAGTAAGNGGGSAGGNGSASGSAGSTGAAGAALYGNTGQIS